MIKRYCVGSIFFINRLGGLQSSRFECCFSNFILVWKSKNFSNISKVIFFIFFWNYYGRKFSIVKNFHPIRNIW